MKVAFYTKEYPPNVYGGAGVHVEYLAAELSKLIDVDVRCFGEQLENVDHLSVQGFSTQPNHIEAADDKLQAIFKTLHTCVEMNTLPVDADVVHSHTWYAQFAGILSKLCYGTPFVLTTHSLEPLRPWKREQLGRGYDASSWIEKTAIEMADAVIAVSKETKEDVLKHFDVAEDKVKVIYNGIDLDQYQATKATDALIEQGIDPNKPYLLFVGRITRQKGILHLVNAIEFIDPELQIVLCAGAPDTKEIGEEMKSLVEKVQQKRDNVFWISEMLPKEKIIQLYTHATVFCCPSIYEPFGIINIEAMACKTAVVASAVGGIKEVVVHGETGLLVPVEQQTVAPFEPVEPEKFAKDLAEAVNLVLHDEALRKQMEEKGRQRVEEYFDWKAIAQQTKELYESLL